MLQQTVDFEKPFCCCQRPLNFAERLNIRRTPISFGKNRSTQFYLDIYREQKQEDRITYFRQIIKQLAGGGSAVRRCQ